MGENIFNFGSAQIYIKDSEGNEINLRAVGNMETCNEEISEKVGKFINFSKGCSGTFKVKMPGEQKRKIKARTKRFELADIFNRAKKFRIKKKLFARIIKLETRRCGNE